MKTLLLASALVLSLSATAAQAGDKSYRFVEGGYVNVDGDADGAYLRGNYEFGQSGLYLTGTATRVNVDNTSFDVNGYEAGLGYRYALSDRFDLYGEATAVRLDVDGLVDADGYRAAVGTRFDVTPNFEGEFKVNHYNGRDFAADNSATLSGHYKFGRNWGVTSGVEFDGDGETYNLGVRASF